MEQGGTNQVNMKLSIDNRHWIYSCALKGKNNNEVQELSKRMEDTIRRIQDNAGILGVMLYTPEGIPIKTTVDNTTAAQVQWPFGII